jgi:ATP-dependent Clp protease protease subunit
MNEILIYDDIGESWFDTGVTGKSVKSQLDEMNGDVTVRINSPGGDVFEGFAIYNLLKEYDGEITVKIDGMAASAASVIAMAGDKVYMADNSLMMIHDPWTLAIGNSSDLAKTIELLDKIKDSIVSTYTTKSQVEENIIFDWMAQETWFNAAEAIENGFADEKDADETQAMNFVKPWIHNAPKKENIVTVQDIEQEQEKEIYKINLYKRKLNLIEQN